jgi:hypothetical protein
MITIVHNQVANAIEIHLDVRGVDLLIEKLQRLKQGADQGMDHLHLHATNDDRGLSTRSPYREEMVYGELILNLLTSEAWEDMARSS